METKDYLIIYGYGIRSPRGCYRELEINQNDIIKFSPLIKEIENRNNEECNWNGTIILEKNKNGDYVEHHLLYDMYPTIEHQLLDEFAKLLPTHISKIESIKIFSGQKIKIM